MPAPKNKDGQGYVYAIEFPEGMVKVGRSQDVHRRFKEICTQWQALGRLVGWTMATKEQEMDLHRLLRGEKFYADRHHKVELYRKGPRVTELIRKLSQCRGGSTEGNNNGKA